MRDHRTILLREAGLEAVIDAELAPIIRELWRRGAATEESCQGDDHDEAYIHFSDAASAKLFVDAVAIVDEIARDDETSGRLRRRGPGRERSIYWRATMPREEGDPDRLLPGKRAWRYEFSPWDASSDLGGDEPIPLGHKSNFQIAVTVWFPHDDLPLIAKRLGVDRPKETK